MELSRSIVIQRHGLLSMSPIWVSGAKACQIPHQTLRIAYLRNRCTDLVHLILWKCLDLQLCNAILICPFTSYELAHVPKTCQIIYHFAEHTSLKPLGLWLWIRIFKVKCSKSRITRIGEPIDTEPKGMWANRKCGSQVRYIYILRDYCIGTGTIAHFPECQWTFEQFEQYE